HGGPGSEFASSRKGVAMRRLGLVGGVVWAVLLLAQPAQGFHRARHHWYYPVAPMPYVQGVPYVQGMQVGHQGVIYVLVVRGQQGTRSDGTSDDSSDQTAKKELKKVTEGPVAPIVAEVRKKVDEVHT